MRSAPCNKKGGPLLCRKKTEKWGERRPQIGRGACRGRGEILGGGGSFKKKKRKRRTGRYCRYEKTYSIVVRCRKQCLTAGVIITEIVWYDWLVSEMLAIYVTGEATDIARY